MNAIRSEQAERIGPLREATLGVVFDTRNRAWLEWGADVLHLDLGDAGEREVHQSVIDNAVHQE